jgi:predicted kinase
MLIAIGGLVASGKSSVAREAARALGAMHVEADQVRDQTLHIEPGQRAHEACWMQNLQPGVTDRVYRKMFERARDVLSREISVVLDGCFATRSQRVDARSLAKRCGTRFMFVECRTSRSVLESRLRARSLDAGVPESTWFALLDRIESRWEPVTELPAEEYLRVDSARPLGSIVEDITAVVCNPPSLAVPSARP